MLISLLLPLAEAKATSLTPSEKMLIERTLQIVGEGNKDSTFIISLANPQNLTINGVKFTSRMGLHSKVTFQKIDKNLSVQGDLLLSEDQVNPVMSTSLEQGLKITSLHNHYFWENPKMMIMHIEGEGKTIQMITAVKKVFNTIKRTQNGRGDILFAEMDPAKTTLDVGMLNHIFKMKGTLKNGVYKINLGEDTLLDAYQNESFAALIGSNREAMLDGDLSVPETKLKEVLSLLRRSEIYIVSIHPEIIASSSRSFMLHYYGLGNARKLAKTIQLAWAIVEQDKKDKVANKIINNLPWFDLRTLSVMDTPPLQNYCSRHSVL